METKREELIQKIIGIVKDLNLTDEKWIKKYGHKSYWEVFLDLFDQQKQEIVEEIEDYFYSLQDKIPFPDPITIQEELKQRLTK